MLATTVDIPGAVPVSQSSGIALRPLRLTDLRKLAWWYNRSVPKHARHYRYRSAEDMRVRLIELAGKDSCHRAITSHGKLVGYCRWNDHMEAFIFIGHPYWRGQGMGTRAMRHLMAEFRLRGKWVMSAKTDRPDFWLKLGFREIPKDWRLSESDRSLGRTMLIWDRREQHGNG